MSIIKLTELTNAIKIELTEYKCLFVAFLELEEPRTYKPWIGNSLLKLYSYSERSQNGGFHPRSHHLAIVQTRSSPPMLGFVYKVLARFDCAIYNSRGRTK